jgi:hypothetical protein
MGGYCGSWEGGWKRWRWGNMVDRLNIHIWNTTMKPLAIALSGARKGCGVCVWEGGDDMTTIQSKTLELSQWIPPTMNIS